MVLSFHFPLSNMYTSLVTTKSLTIRLVDAGVKGVVDQGHLVDGKHVVGQGSKSAASFCKRMQRAMQLVSTS